MMIAIPNVSKPKSCYNHCFEDFIANKEIGCPLNDYIESHQYKYKIHPNCPLIDIVTCGECKWIGVDDGMPFCYWWLREIEPDVFCSYGERRADE